jgi:hypothetical protein
MDTCFACSNSNGLDIAVKLLSCPVGMDLVCFIYMSSQETIRGTPYPLIHIIDSVFLLIF